MAVRRTLGDNLRDFAKGTMNDSYCNNTKRQYEFDVRPNTYVDIQSENSNTQSKNKITQQSRSILPTTHQIETTANNYINNPILAAKAQRDTANNANGFFKSNDKVQGAINNAIVERDNKYKGYNYEQLKLAAENETNTVDKEWLTKKADEVATSTDYQKQNKELTDEWKKLSTEKKQLSKISASEPNNNKYINALKSTVEQMDKLEVRINDTAKKGKEKQYKEILKNNSKIRDVLQKYEDIKNSNSGEQTTDTYTQGQGNVNQQYSDDYKQNIVDAYNRFKSQGYDMDELYKTYYRQDRENESQAINNRISKWAEKNPVIATPSIIVGETLGAIPDAVKYAEATVDKNFNGGDGYVNTNSMSTKQSTDMQQAISDKIDSPVGKFFYNCGMSVAQNVMLQSIGLVTGGAGEALSLGTMGLSAGVQSANETYDSTGNINNSVTEGIFQGLAEILSEKISLDQLKAFKTGTTSTIKDFLKNTGKSMFVEGSEEVGSDVANAITDQIVNGDASQLSNSYNKYINQGNNKKDSFKNTMFDFLSQIGQDFAGGAVAGGILGGGVNAANLFDTKKSSTQLGKEAVASKDFDFNSVISQGLKSDKKSNTYKLSRSLQQKMQNNNNDVHKVAAADVGNLIKLVAQNDNINSQSTEDQQTQSIKTNSMQVNSNAFGTNHKNGLVAKNQNGQTVTITRIESSAKNYGDSDNTVKLRTADGHTVNADDVTFNLPHYNNVINAAKNFDTNGARAMTAYYEDYAEKHSNAKDTDIYIENFSPLYEAGKNGIQWDNVKNSSAFAKQIQKLGSEIAIVAVQSGNNDSNYAFAQNEANKIQEFKVDGNTNTYADSGKLYVENGTEVNIDDNSEIMQALQSLASKSGRNIIFTNNIESGANGKYADGKIYVRAEVDSRYYLSLALHEAGHFVKTNNALEFKALSDFVFNYLTKHGRNVDFLLDDLRSKYAGKYISEEDLKEELVCNSLMAIATDEKATAYAVGYIGTIEKIVSAIKKICTKIKDFLMNGTTNYTAKAFANDIDALQKLAQNLSTSIDNAKANAQSTEKFEGGSEVKVDDQVKYSIEYTDNNDPVVVINENILEGVNKRDWVKTVKNVISKKFSNGIPISGRLIKINAITKNEFTNSKYSNYLKTSDGTIFIDKLNSSNNLDEIVYASTNFVNEGLKHKRADSFKGFARGNVLIRVGNNNYSAKVIIGLTNNDSMVLYDIVNFIPKKIEIKKDKSIGYANNAGSLRNDLSSNTTVSQSDNGVNNQYMQNSEKNSKKSKFALDDSEISNIGDNNYDYSKSFSEQVDDYLANKIPQNDTLIVGKTPEVFKQIGFNALPVTINKTHLEYALHGNKDADHYLGETKLKQLPEKLKNPVAIIKSETKSNNRVVALLDFSQNGKTVIVPVEIDGIGKQNKNNIDSNAVVSIFGKTNAITKLLYDAVKNEANGNVSMFYWNKKEASALLQSAGLQLPRVLPQDGFINSIRNKNANVNIRFENQTETQQFKRWFGDWQNGKVNKKLLNADGTPLVLYHQTGNDFTVFNEKSTGAGQYDSEMPDGIFMKPNNNDIGINGNKQIPVYASIKNPLIVNNRNELVKFYTEHIDGYAELKQHIFDIDSEYRLKLADELKNENAEYQKLWNDMKAGKITEEEYQTAISRDKADEITEEWNTKTNKASTAAKELINNYFANSKYDGIICNNDTGSFGRSIKTYIAFKNTQIKSATDNIGTFDGNNSDIRFAIDDTLNDFIDDFDFFDGSNNKGISFERMIKDNPETAVELVYKSAAKTAERGLLQGKNVKLDDKAMHRITKKIMSDYHISAKEESFYETELTKSLQSLINKVNDDIPFAEAFEKFTTECRNGIMLSADVDEEAMKDEREQLTSLFRNTTLVVTDYEESQIRENYGSVKKYRQIMFGKINVALERNIHSNKFWYMDDIIDTVREMFPALVNENVDSLSGWQWFDNLMNNVLQPKYENHYIDGFYENAETAAIEMAFDATSEMINQKTKQMVLDKKADKKKIREIAKANKTAQAEREALIKAKAANYKNRYNTERINRIEQVNKLRTQLKNNESYDIEQRKKIRKRLAKLNNVNQAQKKIIYSKMNTLREEYNESRNRTVYRNRLARMMSSLAKRLDGKANNNEYIPDTLKNPILEVLGSFTAEPGYYKNGNKRELPGVFNDWKNLINVGKNIEKLTTAYETLGKGEKGIDNSKTEYAYTDIEKLAYRDRTLEMLKSLKEQLGSKNIYELDSYDLKALIDTMEELDKTLKDAVQIIVDGQTMSIQRAAESAILNVENVHFKKDVETDTEKLKNVLSAPRELRNSYVSTQLDPVRYGRFLSGYHDDSITAKIFKELHEGDKKRIKIQQDCELTVQAVTSKYDKKEIRALQRDDVDDFDFKDRNTKKHVKVSKGMLLAIYLTDRQSDGHRHLYSDTDFNHYTVISDLMQSNGGHFNKAKEYSHEVRFSKADLEHVARYVKSDPLLNDLSGAIGEVFNIKLRNAINEVSMAKYGKKIATVNNYFPIIVDKDGAKYEKNFDAEFNDIRLKSQGFTKQREHSSSAIVIDDALRVFKSYVNSAAEYCGLLAPIENFKKVYNWNNGSNTMHKVINNKFGDAATHYIEKLMGDLQKPKDTIDNNWFTKAAGNYMGATLLLNPGAMIKQFGAFPTANKYFGTENVAKAMAGGWKKIDIEKYNTLTPYLWYRAEGNSTIIGEISQAAGITKKMLDKMDIMGRVDRIVVNSLLYSAELHVEQTTELKRGTDEFYKEVVRQWEKCIDETQPNNMVTSKPQFIRNNVMRVLTLNAFRSQTMSIANCMIDSFMEYSARSYDYKSNKNTETKAAKNEAKKNLIKTVIGAVESSIFVGALTVIANAFIWHKWDKLKDDEGNITIGTICGQTFENALSDFASLFAWGDLAYETAAAAISGGKFYGLEVMSLDNVNDLISDLEKGKYLKSLGVIGNITGVPINNGIRIISSVEAYVKDLLIGNGEIITDSKGNIDQTYLNKYIVYALKNGNTERAKAYEELYKKVIVGEGKSDSEATKAVKNKIVSALADEDDIEKATLEKYNGNLDEYESIVDKYTSYGFDSEDIKKAVAKVITNIGTDMKNNEISDDDAITDLLEQGFNEQGAKRAWDEISKSDNESENKKITSAFDDTSEGAPTKYSYNDYFEVVKNGDKNNADRIKKYFMDSGKKASDIKSALRSASRTDPMWSQYLESVKSNDSQTVKALKEQLTNIYGSWATATSYMHKYQSKQKK